MNREIRDILKPNIGKAASVYFHGTDDDTFRSGVIKEVTDSIATPPMERQVGVWTRRSHNRHRSGHYAERVERVRQR